MSEPEPFPPVYWAAWNADATFLPADALPTEDTVRLYAVLVFVFYGDQLALADIPGRGLTIPSGRIEPGETASEAAVREVWEEVGGRLGERLELIGSYRLTTRSGETRGATRWCPVFIAEAQGFDPIPDGSESRSLRLASMQDIPDLYFAWDPLMEAVFAYVGGLKDTFFPASPNGPSSTRSPAPPRPCC